MKQDPGSHLVSLEVYDANVALVCGYKAGTLYPPIDPKSNYSILNPL